MLKPGTETTRTLSPYFSPKSAIAPPLMASSVLRSSVTTARVAVHLLVHGTLHIAAFVVRHGHAVGEVESQPIGRDERARLAHVRAEPLPERGVQQVRGGVVAARRVTRRAIDRRANRVAGAQRRRT